MGDHSRAALPPGSVQYQALAAIAILVVFVATVWGIRGNLPYTPEADEPILVERAARMALTGPSVLTGLEYRARQPSIFRPRRTVDPALYSETARFTGQTLNDSLNCC